MADRRVRSHRPARSGYLTDHVVLLDAPAFFDSDGQAWFRREAHHRDHDSFTLTDIKGAEFHEVAAVLERPSEPDVARRARVERVEAVAAAAVDLKRNWLTSNELDALPDVLQLGEVPRVIARATKGGGTRVCSPSPTGVRCSSMATASSSTSRFSLIRAVRSVDPPPSKVTIETDAESFTLTDIQGAALDEVVAALERPLG